MTKNLLFPVFHTILDDFKTFDNNKKMSYCNSIIEEDDKNYIINIDMPGVKKEDLEVGIKENILSISAKRKKSTKLENGEANEEVIANYEQSFNVNTKSVDIENIEASLEYGVLKLTLPKKEEIKYERKINIA